MEWISYNSGVLTHTFSDGHFTEVIGQFVSKEGNQVDVYSTPRERITVRTSPELTGEELNVVFNRLQYLLTQIPQLREMLELSNTRTLKDFEIE